jgi:hypothetical protein
MFKPKSPRPHHKHSATRPQSNQRPARVTAGAAGRSAWRHRRTRRTPAATRTCFRPRNPSPRDRNILSTSGHRNFGKAFAVCVSGCDPKPSGAPAKQPTSIFPFPRRISKVQLRTETRNFPPDFFEIPQPCKEELSARGRILSSSGGLKRAEARPPLASPRGARIAEPGLLPT